MTASSSCDILLLYLAKVYYFSPASNNDVYEEKSGVIVETAKGLEYGTVVFGVKEIPDEEIVHPLKPVLRKATIKDEKKVKENEEKIPSAMRVVEEKIAKRNLDMKLVGCEFSFDGKKLVVYFTADGRVDFRWIKVKSLVFCHFNRNLGKLTHTTTATTRSATRCDTTKKFCFVTNTDLSKFNP